MGWLWPIGVIGIIICFSLLQLAHLGLVLRWAERRTVGLNYYGLSSIERQRFKRQLQWHARLLGPVLWLNQQWTALDFRKARIRYRGISAPSGSCSIETFAAAETYVPRPHDIFIVTQMKCGTTWMQHLVYEILCRGSGDLVETDRTLYAVSPWIEGFRSVPIDQAPLIGTERPSRIIKTHLPVQLCPYSSAARYIYVARNPISCFASCVDFLATNLGRTAPRIEKIMEWYTSHELMWWGTWTKHVQGWWERAQIEKNVLFICFEEMNKNLMDVVRRVQNFLGVPPLREAELAAVLRKCSFGYMKKHQGHFEMHPPHLLQSDAEVFASGKGDRYNDVPEHIQQAIASWAVKEMRATPFPVAAIYPELLLRVVDQRHQR